MIRGVLARLVGMMVGVGFVAVRDVGVVARFFMVSGGVMLGCGAMMLRGMLVMLGGFQMVVFAFFRHVDELAFCKIGGPTGRILA